MFAAFTFLFKTQSLLTSKHRTVPSRVSLPLFSCRSSESLVNYISIILDFKVFCSSGKFSTCRLAYLETFTSTSTFKSSSELAIFSVQVAAGRLLLLFLVAKRFVKTLTQRKRRGRRKLCKMCSNNIRNITDIYVSQVGVDVQFAAESRITLESISRLKE